MTPPLLFVEDLKTHFFTGRGITKAVDGVSFTLRAGETLALVGESGSGKSVTCLSLVRLVPEPAGRIVGGRVLLDGEDLLGKSPAEMRRVRGKQIAMVLQDPMTSLNPALTIGTQIGEVVRLHQGLRGASLRARALEALRRLRIAAAETRLGQFQHQLSGGMRQRVSSAIAMSCAPRLLIADEPTTSLDVTIQAQYLDLLKEVQQATGVAVILVTHDFGIVAANADRVAVMYAGRIVEIGSTLDLFNAPAHPYTRALLRCLPDIDARGGRLGIAGESGPGKPTLAKLFPLLERPTAGSLRFDGKAIEAFGHGDLAAYRRAVQAVFQDPYSSLNPRMRVEHIVAEPLPRDNGLSRAGVRDRVGEVLQLVGLRRDSAALYPHEFSGGQRQRIALAPALVTHPKLIVPTGAVPNRMAPPAGCRFHPRCPHAMPQCRTAEPVFKEVERGRFTACHLY